MPTFTTVALDSLIEPKASKLMAPGKNIPESKLERMNSNSTITRQGSGTNGADGKAKSSSSAMTIERKHHWTQISPALYATPEPTPLPDSPSSFPPSPYIVDHKRRGPRLSKTFSDDDAVLRQALSDEKTVETAKSLEAEGVGSSKVFKITDAVSSDVEDGHVKFLLNEDLGKNTNNDDTHGQDKPTKSGALERDSEIDDFFDPQDSLSIRSSTDGETNYGLDRSLNPSTPFAEFYDAWEELSSETGTSHPSKNIEAELRELRLRLLMEMEKRKQAENHLNDMRSQWGRIREQLSLVGLSFPADPTILEDEPTDDPGEELCRQVELLRFVSNCVGRGITRAELEMELEAQLQSKNFEIARLLDRLHYYEAVNHEMSQRNQETVETMRRLRQRRKRRQRWIWGSIAAAITLGSTALAWSYLPTGKGSSSTNPTQTSEGNRSVQ